MKALQFNGNGTEYFKIWIVNILLTIVTLGIYYPWAKVRSRRYFYGNTELDNANFEYHATGKQLFVSYIIAMVIFAIYVGVGQVFPMISGILAVLFFFIFPWIIWRSLKFNFRMSSYRNVRFGFNGALGRSYAVFMGYPIAVIFAFVILIFIGITIGGGIESVSSGMGALLVIPMFILMFLAYPAFFAMMNKLSQNYVINGAHFGQGQFSADLEFKPFFIILLKAMGLSILLSILAFIAVGLLAYLIVGADQIMTLGAQMQAMEQGAQPNALFFIVIFSVYAFFIAVGMYVLAYIKAKNRAYVFSNTTLDNTISFESTLQTGRFFSISLTNFILLIFTLGLAYPWAAVRLYRYSIESIEVEAKEGFDGYMSKAGSENALGEELGDAFDIDVGGIAF